MGKEMTNICIYANGRILLNVNQDTLDEEEIRETEKEMLKLVTDNKGLLNPKNETLEVKHHRFKR